jgi:hypothetical protein
LSACASAIGLTAHQQLGAVGNNTRKIMDQRNMVDDSSVSDIYTTDGANKDEFRMDQEETIKQMKHLLDTSVLVPKDEDDDLGNMSDMNDDNASVLSDNALFRAEVEVRAHCFDATHMLPNMFRIVVYTSNHSTFTLPGLTSLLNRRRNEKSWPSTV